MESLFAKSPVRTCISQETATLVFNCTQVCVGMTIIRRVVLFIGSLSTFLFPCLPFLPRYAQYVPPTRNTPIIRVHSLTPPA